MAFSVSSLLVPVLAVLYLMVSRNYTHKMQIYYLNLGLLCLYIFPLCVYLLISLPTASPLQNNATYQMLFHNLPHKFFATTLAYLISFYVPLLIRKYVEDSVPFLYQNQVRAFGGGLVFFLLHAFFLSQELIESFNHFFPSLLLLLFLMSLFLGLTFRPLYHGSKTPAVLPNFLANSNLIILLACLACEYRLMHFDHQYLLTASGILFPLALMFFNLFSENFRNRDAYILIALLVAAPLLFDVLSLMLVASSEARYSTLQTWYQLFMPRRMAAEALALLLALLTNIAFSGIFMRFLGQRFIAARIYLANTLSNTLLCISNYAVLYGGIFAYEEIRGLVINNWCYKMLVGLVLLPLTCLLIRRLRPHAVPSIPWPAAAS